MGLAGKSADGEHGHPRLAFLVGLACWGADAAAARARAWSSRSETAPTPAAPDPPGPSQLRARGLLLGLAVTISARGRSALKRGGIAATPVVRGFLRCGRTALKIPGVSGAMRRAAALREQAALRVERIAASGELEAARCQRLARIGVAEIVDGTLGAVARASEIREVLVEQSAGLMGEAVVEVRRQAERADSLLEDALRSFLGLRRRGAPPANEASAASHA
jgi:hypothetical protein